MADQTVEPTIDFSNLADALYEKLVANLIVHADTKGSLFEARGLNNPKLKAQMGWFLHNMEAAYGKSMAGGSLVINVSEYYYGI